MPESAESEHIRDLPTTVVYTVTFIILGLVSGAVSVAIGTLPSTAWLIITDGFEPTTLQIYLGLLLGIAIPGISNMNFTHSNSDEGKSNLENFRETMEILQDNIGFCVIVLSLMGLYINILFMSTLWATKFMPAWAWYITLVAPFADRAMVISTGYSPAFTPIMAVAKALEWIHLGSDVDLDLVRTLNPAGLTQPQTSVA